MAIVKPFKGVRYNLEKVKYDDVIAPPYDVISDSLLEELYGKSDYNIVRIDFGKKFNDDSEENNRYSRAAATRPSISSPTRTFHTDRCSA